MEKKINIAELLKDCPKGMELYSPIFGEVYLDKIRPHLAIVVTTDKKQGDSKEEFLYDGRYGMNGECMLFPSKGKTTWEGFVPPCDFKEGDVIYVRTRMFKWVSIFKKETEYKIVTYADYNLDTNNFHGADNYGEMTLCQTNVILEKRIATEEEKQKLFKAIKEHGYKWNAVTKTLEKLVEPKFKVGDRIERFGCRYTITEIRDNYYLTKQGDNIRVDNQDVFELVPNKFDINTLKPFDRVLVRNVLTDKWRIGIFEKIDTEEPKYDTVCSSYRHCIPYLHDTKHLLGKVEMEPEFYQVDEYLL